MSAISRAGRPLAGPLRSWAGMHAHLLFVEESEGFLQPLRQALDKTGLTSSLVRGSEDLECLLRSVCPDMVVVEAPAPDGRSPARPAAVDVCRRIYPWLPVVVQLRDPSRPVGVEAKRLGADLVLEESGADDETTWRVRRLLGGRRMGSLG